MRPVLVLLIAFFPLVAIAQPGMYYPDAAIQFFAYGSEQTLACGGGFNNPQFSMGDLNHDGLPDLIVFEPWIGITTFINNGWPGSPAYRYAPEYALNFPPIYDYLVLADYNCDGVPDLFQQGTSGFSVYRGYYNAQNQLCFAFYKDLYYNNDVDTHGSANAFNNPGDIPAIVDVDNDGDLDFIAYNVTGGFMNLYRNMQVEMGLPCDTIHIALKDKCWGKVYQGFYRTHSLAQTCDNSSLHRESGERKTHSGNTPCLFDWDMDGDYDYLDGSVSYNEMTFLQNGKTSSGPDSMIFQDTLWQTGGRQINIPIWPAAYSLDIDQDGKKDLLIAPNGGSSSINANNVWFYKNYSTPGSPDWRFQSDSFLCDKMIDLGSAAYPALFDYNKDGKPDLFIGSDGYRQSTGLMRSRISYYLNTSTAGHPQFTLQTTDFMGLSTSNFAGIAPTLGDIDNDGIADLIVGHTDGTLSYYKNMAASDAVTPIWQLVQLQLIDNASAVINVGDHAAPFIYDIDKDGKKDLIIGQGNGYIQYYHNVSTTPGTIQLQLVNKRLGLAKADPRRNSGNYSVPFIGRVDTTGIEYLVMGGNSGNIYRFTGFQGGDTTAIYTMVDSQYSYIDSSCNTYTHLSTTFFGLYDNLRAAPVMGDVTGDGDYEMFVGDIRGGIRAYRFGAHAVAKVQPQEVHNEVLIYPNPASDILNISWSSLKGQTHITITNISGQQYYSGKADAKEDHTMVTISSLPAGLYICVLENEAGRYFSKFTVIR